MSRIRTRYTQRTDGEVVVVPEGNVMKLECCDCGLVHRIQFGTFTFQRKKRVTFRAWRDNRATAQRRRRKA